MINEQTVKLKVASTSVEYARWGEITGNIESQTDLMNLLGERDLDDVQEAITQGLDNIDTAKEEAIEEIDQHGGVTEAVKQALLNCFAHVAWIDDQGQTYYDALEEALYPPANLVSISAVYTQSGTVYDNQTLDSLKSDLVVTAFWDNQTTTTVTDYTLSGTLTEGTSTITVLYADKSTTFNVTVTHATVQYTITNTLTQCTNSNNASVINELTAYSGTLTANSGYVMGTVSITMGGTDITSTAYDSSTKAISIASVTGNIVITAEAVEDVGWVSGVAYSDIDWGDGGYALDTSGNIKTSSNSNDHVCDFIPCHNASAIKLSVKPHDSTVYFYDENQTFIYRVGYVINIANVNNSEFPVPVPRNAYYFRVLERSSTPNTIVVTPYAYTKLTESTAYQLNTYYSMDYEAGTESSMAISLFGLCYGATSMQTSLYSRSFITFYDAEKSKISQYTRQLVADEIAIPEGTYYLKINPGSETSNSNNPWIKFTA